MFGFICPEHTVNCFQVQLSMLRASHMKFRSPPLFWVGNRDVGLSQRLHMDSILAPTLLQDVSGKIGN